MQTAQSIKHLAKLIGTINGIIMSIWDYKLELVKLNSGEKPNYRFSVEVGNDIVEDISLLSSSQREIIDMAMRLLIVKYANVGVVVLDEFGRTFDIIHGSKTVDMVTKLSEAYQVFAITHADVHAYHNRATIVSLSKDYMEDYVNSDIVEVE